MEFIIENWDHILDHMCREHNIASVSCDVWLKPLKPYKLEDDILYIICDNVDMAGYVEKKYKLPLQASIGEFINKLVEVIFITEDSIEEEKEETKNSNSTFSNYTFENFVVSDTNKFAYAASLAVAESPGEVYNPLFIYSNAGLGKTHLMYSIENFIIKNSPDKKVLYVTSEEFTYDLIEAIGNKNGNSIAKFRDKFRNIDVLLIDDIQFIIGKISTQEEFFHTFNELHRYKKQIVISSDKPPKDFDNLEERLLGRFEMGLIADISTPNYETRMAILKNNIENKGIDIKEDVLDYIATNVTSNIRELNGALNKLIAFTQLEKDRTITLEIAERELRDIIAPDSPNVITPEFIIHIVCNKFDVTPEEIKSSKRNSYINEPRQIIMYLCRKYTGISLVELGKLLGRDHSTIISGVDKIVNKMNEEPEFKNTIKVLVQMINP